MTFDLLASWTWTIDVVFLLLLVAGTAFFNAPDKARFIRVCRGEV